jgi:hypothetical protein
MRAALLLALALSFACSDGRRSGMHGREIPTPDTGLGDAVSWDMGTRADDAGPTSADSGPSQCSTLSRCAMGPDGPLVASCVVQDGREIWTRESDCTPDPTSPRREPSGCSMWQGPNGTHPLCVRCANDGAVVPTTWRTTCPPEAEAACIRSCRTGECADNCRRGYLNWLRCEASWQESGSYYLVSMVPLPPPSPCP